MNLLYTVTSIARANVGLIYLCRGLLDDSTFLDQMMQLQDEPIPYFKQYCTKPRPSTAPTTPAPSIGCYALHFDVILLKAIVKIIINSNSICQMVISFKSKRHLAS